jgi:hypothetical protein
MDLSKESIRIMDGKAFTQKWVEAFLSRRYGGRKFKNHVPK